MLSGSRFLVVEDEMLVLMLAEDMLADLGCTSIAPAATVKQALALIDEQTFDAAMLDMNLNGENTIAVADALAARGIPFIFATGYASLDRRDGHRDRPVLNKPYQPHELATALKTLLAPDPIAAP